MPFASTNLLLPLAVLSAFLSSCDAQSIFSISPGRGSRGGATRLTISGKGFAQDSQFQLNPQDDTFGNRVTLVSSNGAVEYDCPVERDSTHGDQIMCYTQPMPYGVYFLKVTVDGELIPNTEICRGRYWNDPCRYVVNWWHSPTIDSMTVISGLPGTVVTMRGRMFTDAFGSSNRTSTNGVDARIVRAYMGGMPCELLKTDSDELYRLALDNENSRWGYMSCKITGTYIGHHNLTYIVDGSYGRSKAENDLFLISAAKTKIGMFQTFAEVTGVSPSQGSIKGGTTLTIHGRHLGDQTDHPARVVVGGLPCEILDVADDKILCKTPEWQPNEHAEAGVGGRGLKMEIWNTRPGSLEDIWTYNNNTPGHRTQWVDSTPFRFPNEDNWFTSLTKGFLVVPSTGIYILHLHCDDRCELYMSNSSRPEHKEKIAFQPSYMQPFKVDSQKSEILSLEKGKPYYIEILFQEYHGVASINLALFTAQSSVNKKQTSNAVNEIQTLVAERDVYDEEQVLTSHC